MIARQTKTALFLAFFVQSATQPAELNGPSQSPAHEEEEDNSLLQVWHDKENLRAIPSMGVVKVHKCASSTTQKIAQSLAITRNMSMMFPEDTEEPNIGWPSPFPGVQSLAKIGLPRHQYQSISHHAVFNETMWRAYLEEKPGPVFVTVLREPVDQAISAYNYIKDQSPIDEQLFPDWESHLFWLEHLPMDVEPRRWQSMFRNGMAWDMGWYEYVGWTAKHDYNKSMVDAWISTLEGSFNQMGGHILQEYYDEGLVLLKKRLKVDIKELSYIRTNDRNKKIHVEPTPEQRDRLKKLNPVDHALFEHFNKTFAKLWQPDDQENKELLAQLKQANADYESFCALQKGEEKGFCRLWTGQCMDGFCAGLDTFYDLFVQEIGGCMPPACTS